MRASASFAPNHQPCKRQYSSWLNNTNPLLRMGYPGTIGLKTGDTDEAGHCLIAVVKHGSRTVGVVLLNSPNPQQQARSLLAKAFRADRA